MEILGNQILGIQPPQAMQISTVQGAVLRANPKILFSQFNLPPSISQFCQLGSTATLIDFPQIFELAGLIISDLNLQDGMALQTAVEPYILMAINPAQA